MKGPKVDAQLAPTIGFIVSQLYRAGVPFATIREVAAVAEEHGFGESWFSGEESDASKALAFALSTLLAAVRASGADGTAMVNVASRFSEQLVQALDSTDTAESNRKLN